MVGLNGATKNWLGSSLPLVILMKERLLVTVVYPKPVVSDSTHVSHRTIDRSIPKRRSAPRSAGCFAPIATVQTSGTISPKRSLVDAASNGWLDCVLARIWTVHSNYLQFARRGRSRRYKTSLRRTRRFTTDLKFMDSTRKKWR